MKEFMAGVLITLLAVAPIAAVWLRKKSRQSHRYLTEPSDIDGELAKLTGELAHELKNPLSTIKVNLKLTKEALDDVGSTEPHNALSDQRQHKLASALRKITIVQKETDRLDQILDGFLTYVRRADLQFATMDLNELVGDMIDFYTPQAYSHALTVRQGLTEKALTCRVDPGALKQVLLNLFINAQQAMSDGGELMIRTSRLGDRAIVQISDTGKGIPAEKLPTIFRPYYSSRSGGTGLGLATAKKIVEAHSGTITVHSEPGKGTSFTIELPLVSVDIEPDEVIE